MASFFMKSTAGLPNWAWTGIIVGGVGLGLWFSQRSRNAASQTDTGAEQVTSPDVASSINPVGSGYSDSGGHDIIVIPPITTPSQPDRQEDAVQERARVYTFVVIRERFSIVKHAGYDAGEPGGVPLWDTPNEGRQIGKAAFGQILQTTGIKVMGKKRTLWPTLSGYVADEDVARSYETTNPLGNEG